MSDREVTVHRGEFIALEASKEDDQAILTFDLAGYGRVAIVVTQNGLHSLCSHIAAEADRKRLAFVPPWEKP